MKNCKTKTKIVFFIAFATLIVLVAGLFLGIKSLKTRNQKVVEDRVELGNSVSLMRSMQQVRRSVISSLDEQEEFGAFFITEDSIPYFLGTLEAVANRVGVGINVSRVSLGGDRKQLSIGLRVVGDFNLIHHYIKAIEYTPFRLQINRIFLQKSGEQDLGGSGQWSADMEISLKSYTEESLPVLNQRGQ